MKYWTQFEDDLGKFLPSGDKEIINMLRRRFHHTNDEFRTSQKCTSELQKCLDCISRQPHRVYTILNDLKMLFKREAKVSLKKASSLSPSRVSSDPSPTALPEDSSNIYQSKRTNPNPTTSLTDGKSSQDSMVIDIECSDSDDGVHHHNGGDNDNDNNNNDSDAGDSDIIILNSSTPTQSPRQIPSPKQSTNDEKLCTASTQPKTSCANRSLDRKRALITRLERLLARISKAIKKLEEEELDLDALESADSPYVQLDVLKRRYLEVWRRLCEARRVARISGRILRRRFTYTGSRYASINSMIEELVNDKKRFPDMADIRNIVSLVNKNEKLMLSSTAVTELARHIFVDVGHSLKRRRQADLLHDFGCYLTDDLREEDDPTYSDPSLRRRLAENRHLGEIKLNSVFDRFVRLQQSAPVELDDSDEAETTVQETSQPVTTESPIPIKRSKLSSESDDSESEPSETPTHEVVMLSSDSDVPIDSYTSEATATHTGSVSLNCSATDEPVVVVPDDPPTPPPLPVESHCLSNDVPSEQIIHLTDDDDDDNNDDAPITRLDVVPVTNALSVAPYPSRPSLVSPLITGHFSLLRPYLPPTATHIHMETSHVFKPSPVYPVIQETQSVTTMTRRCSVNGIGGHQIHTSVYKQATTTNRVFYRPALVPQQPRYMPTNVCVSSFRTLSSPNSQLSLMPPHPNTPQTIEERQNAERSSPRDCSGPIILD